MLNLSPLEQLARPTDPNLGTQPLLARHPDEGNLRHHGRASPDAAAIRGFGAIDLATRGRRGVSPALGCIIPQ